MIHSMVLKATSSDFANIVTMIHENRFIAESSTWNEFQYLYDDRNCNFNIHS
jgi:hypothetical protein